MLNGVIHQARKFTYSFKLSFSIACLTVKLLAVFSIDFVTKLASLNQDSQITMICCRFVNIPLLLVGTSDINLTNGRFLIIVQIKRRSR